jgi:hypothetical protein
MGSVVVGENEAFVPPLSAWGGERTCGDARGTRQKGRTDAKENKQDCLESGDTRSECRQEERKTKQGARQGAREIKRKD